MTALSTPVRIIVCGLRTAIGKSVAESLRPDYEVIHFIQSVEAGKAEIPQILAGKVPQPAEPNEVGTHDYSQPARIVLFGRGYTRAQAEEIHQCVGVTEQPIAWVVGDPTQAPVGVPPPGYAEKTAAAIKKVMDAWRDEGGVRDGFIEY